MTSWITWPRPRRSEAVQQLDSQLTQLTRERDSARYEADTAVKELGDARDAERAQRRRADALEAELAGAFLGVDVGALMAENQRLHRAFQECEDRRAELRREVERLEAERFERGSGRWSGK